MSVQMRVDVANGIVSRFGMAEPSGSCAHHAQHRSCLGVPCLRSRFGPALSRMQARQLAQASRAAAPHHGTPGTNDQT